MAGTMRADAVVVGAGTAGANAAYQLARAGLSVVVVERRAADRAGARWHNALLDRHFDEAGLDRPVAPERGDAGGTTRIFGPGGRPAVTLRSPTVRVDMVRLGARLRDRARERGARIVDEVRRVEAIVSGDRIVALDLERAPCGAGAPGRGSAAVRVEAALFVDATGRARTVGRQSPVLDRWCRPVPGDDLCTAGDFHLRIADVEGARRWLDDRGVAPGDTVNELGLHGGFSARAVTVARDLRQVAVLVGCLADGRHGPAPELLRELRAEQPWIGEPVSGGFGVIPLRRPYARFTAPGVALVGDAACQVYPAHGSGVGFGLVAGRLLADAVTGAGSPEAGAQGREGRGDPGDERTLWAYQAAFQRAHGGLLAAVDGFRRMSVALGSAGVGAMVDAGLMTEASTLAGLQQRWADLPARELAAQAARLARAPRLARIMVPRLARAQLAYGMGDRYPAAPDDAALRRWDARVARLVGA